MFSRRGRRRFVIAVALALAVALPLWAEEGPPAEVPVTVEALLGVDHPEAPLTIVWPETDWVAPTHVVEREALLEAKERALWDPTLPAGRDVGEASEVGPLPLTPGLRRRFEGIQFDQTFGFPPDTVVAASETTVIEAVNTALQLSDRNGNGRLFVSFREFFADDGFLFDPKIYFDPLSERFFLVVIEQNDPPQQSFIHIAVSRSASPRGFGSDDWCGYIINSRRNGAWGDYPGLGMNERWMVVSVNNFKFSGGFDTVFLYAIEKDELLPNSESCPRATYTGFRPASGFTMQPAQYAERSGAAGSPLHMVMTRGGSSSSYDLWTLRDDGSGAVLESAVVTGTFAYSPPPDGPQLGGGDLDSGDARITQAVYRDGLVWAVHGTGCAIGELPNESCVRVVGIDPSGAVPSIAFEETFGNRDWYAFWPGIAVNVDGDVVVGFQRSRADRYLDFSYSGKRGTSVRFAPTRTMKIGQCGLFLEVDDIGRLRTGDYVGLQVDPLDDRSFWLAGEYSTRDPVWGCTWATSISRTAYAAPPPAPPPLATGTLPGGATPAPGAAPEAPSLEDPGQGRLPDRLGPLQRDEGRARQPIEK